MLYTDLMGGWRATPGELVLMRQAVPSSAIRLARAKDGVNGVGIVFLKTTEGAAIEKELNFNALGEEDEVDFENPVSPKPKEPKVKKEKPPNTGACVIL